MKNPSTVLLQIEVRARAARLAMETLARTKRDGNSAYQAAKNAVAAMNSLEMGIEELHRIHGELSGEAPPA